MEAIDGYFFGSGRCVTTLNLRNTAAVRHLLAASLVAVWLDMTLSVKLQQQLSAYNEVIGGAQVSLGCGAVSYAKIEPVNYCEMNENELEINSKDSLDYR